MGKGRAGVPSFENDLVDRIDAERGVSDASIVARMIVEELGSARRKGEIAKAQRRVANRKQEPAGGYVYFVQQGDDGPIKISFSTTPKARMRVLQTGCAARLWVLAVIPGGPKVERSLHDRFAHHRLQGEWFNPTPALLEYIETLQESPLDCRTTIMI